MLWHLGLRPPSIPIARHLLPWSVRRHVLEDMHGQYRHDPR